jgi:RHS repeat-associated protein
VHTASRFTGKERDTESGLDNFGYRYYSSSMGRWMSPDPTGLDYADLTNPQSFNLYSYVLNNPLKFSDPNGLYCAWEDGTSDDDPSDGGASHGDCDAQGGHWTDDANPCHGADNCTATFDWNPPKKGCVESALRAVVASGEGTDRKPGGGYGTIVGGTVLSVPPGLIENADITGWNTKNIQIADPQDLTGHPNILVQVGPGLKSTAFGRYQILAGTAKSNGFSNFSPAGQDAAANTLMSNRGMVNAAMQGNIQGAIQKGGKEWASLPGSPYGQPTISMDSALQTYGQTILSSSDCQ